jgi:hypothetical protein
MIQRAVAYPHRFWLGNHLGLFRSDAGGVTLTQVLNTPVGAIDFNASTIAVGGSASGEHRRRRQVHPVDVE